MAALLVRRLLWRVSQTLTDTKPQQFKRYTERDMVMAAQCGVKALCKFLPHVGIRSCAIKLEPGTRQSIAVVPAARVKFSSGAAAFDLFAIQFEDLIRNLGDDGLSPGRAIRIADRQRRDRLDPNWHVGEPDAVVREFFFSPQDPTTFFVSPPVPGTGAVWVDVQLVAPPQAIPDGGPPGSELYAYDDSTPSTQAVGIDDQFEDELWNYCVAYLLLADAKSQESMARAQLHAQAFMGSINSLAASLTGQNPNLKTLPFAPDVPGAAS
jgi:hypothetical protein